MKANDSSSSPLSNAEIDARIRDVRTSEVELRVLGPDRKPLVDTPVTVTQRAHRFRFGGMGFRADLHRDTAHNQRFLELFNSAIIHFYWGEYEPERGQPEASQRTALARWYLERGIEPKGHPLGWHMWPPEWQLGTPPQEMLEQYLERVRREVSGFAGLIDHWDVVNELQIAPEWTAEPSPFGEMVQQIGRLETARLGCEAARQANPDATLAINDYENSDRNFEFLRRCIDEGVDFDVVGLQSHMYAAPMENVDSWERFTLFKEPEEMWNTCERFARLGKPLHFTELDISSGRLKDWPGQPWMDDWVSTPEGEARQEEHLVKTVRTLFSHPAVESIVFWDFIDPGFMGAPIGLLHRNGEPKPAFHALRRLIREDWWIGPVELRTDEQGTVRLRGFHGDYTLSARDAASAFSIKPGQPSLEVVVSTG